MPRATTLKRRVSRKRLEGSLWMVEVFLRDHPRTDELTNHQVQRLYDVVGALASEAHGFLDATKDPRAKAK